MSSTAFTLINLKIDTKNVLINLLRHFFFRRKEPFQIKIGLQVIFSVIKIFGSLIHQSNSVKVGLGGLFVSLEVRYRLYEIQTKA